MTARKNAKKTLQPRFSRRPLPALDLEPQEPVHPALAQAHKNAEEVVRLVRRGSLDAAARFADKIDDIGTLRAYVVAFAAIAAGKPMPAVNVQTPEDGADDAVETR